MIAGLYASRFALTNILVVLLALLASFAVLDGVALTRIQRIQRRPIESVAELRSTREQIDRLARFLLLMGAAFGGLFVVTFIMMLFSA